MQYRHTLLALVAATTVIAAPLNINLGAYSPALVVGDGEIGFKGGASVTALMNTLQGAAANSAAANGAAAPGVVAPAAGGAGVVEPAAIAEPQQGMGKNVNVLPLVTRTVTDGAVLTAEELEILEDEEEDLIKRSPIDGAVLTAEEIEILEDEKDEAAVVKRVVERDIAGFNAALAYASGALKTAPEVQLGTGEKGSGIGILQKAGGVTSTPAKTNGTAGKAERKRELVVLEG